MRVDQVGSLLAEDRQGRKLDVTMKVARTVRG